MSNKIYTHSRLLLLCHTFIIMLAATLFTPWFIGETRWVSKISAINQEAYPLVFPDDFFWGVAVAAQHVEHQQPSDWTAFERRVVREGLTGTGDRPGQARPGHIHNLDKVSPEVRFKKVDFDNRFEKDFEALAEMGLNSYRLSLSWARLFPEADMRQPDPKGIAFYSNVIDKAIANGLNPHISLFHFSSPEWFWTEQNGKKGWERPDALEHWERYVSAVAGAFGGKVTSWCTLNEPMVYVLCGYMEGIFPPLERRQEPVEIAPVVAVLLEAHALAYQILHSAAADRGAEAQVGLTQHTRAFEPLRNWHLFDRMAARFVRSAFIWDVFDAIENGKYSMTNTEFSREIPNLAGSQDYIGINYYGRFYVQLDIDAVSDGPIIHTQDQKDPNEVVSDLGWALYPVGFANILEEAWIRYQKPIQILENGIADASEPDNLRQTFLVSHLREVWYAMNILDVDIDGYFHWSHLDNFEWAEGFGPRFGLFSVDYQNDFKREARPSVKVYSQIVDSGISNILWDKHRGPF